MNKSIELHKIAKEIENCKICKIGKIGKAVVGEGSESAKVMFIGEAPGKTEALTGRPFLGRSGQLLRSLIREAGLKEESVFITSPVKYLPKYGTPNPSDVKHGKIHLQKQVDVINPKLIVLLGSVAIKGVLGEKIPVILNHGKAIEKYGRLHFLTLHPAAAIRFKKNKVLIVSDFKKLKSVIDKKI